MMAAILNSVMLVSDTVIYGFRHLVIFSQIHSKTFSCSTLILTQTNSIWLKLIHSHFTWWWQPSWILTMLDSAILVFPFKLYSILPKIRSHHLHKKHFIHLFWLNLMMAAILNYAMLDSDTAILDSDTLLSSLRFTQIHSDSTPILTQTNSIWLKLFLFHLTVMMAAILNLAILDSDTLLSSLRFTQKHSHSTLSLTQTNSIWLTWRWQPSRVLPSWIQPICTKKFHSFIMTQIDDGSHLEFCHLVFCHLEIFFQTDSHLPRFSSHHLQKNFTHSFWLNLMMAAILNSATLEFGHLGFWHLSIFFQTD